MRLLLDTHLAVWWEAGDAHLPDAVRDLVLGSADDVFVSLVSLWEMAIKVGMGRLRVDFSRFAARVEQTGFLWLGIEIPHILAVATLPVFADHKDPFDRLLVAQSLAEPLVLLTVDANLARYGPTVRVV